MQLALPALDLAADASRDRLYVSTKDGRVVALDQATGKTSFSLDLGEGGGPLALSEDKNFLHAATRTGRIRRLDLRTLEWTDEYVGNAPWNVLVARPGHPLDVIAQRYHESGTPELSLLLLRDGQPAPQSVLVGLPLGEFVADLALDARGREVDLRRSGYPSTRAQVVPDPAGRLVDLIWVTTNGWHSRTFDRFTRAALADEEVKGDWGLPVRAARMGNRGLVGVTEKDSLVFWTRRFSEHLPATDLTVAFSAPSPGAFGAESSIEIQIGNLGSASATNVLASLWLPEGFGVAAVPDTDADVHVEPTAQTLRLHWPQLSPGASRLVRVDLRPEVGGRFELRAAVRSENQVSHPNHEEATLDYRVSAEPRLNALRQLRLPVRDVGYSPMLRELIVAVGPEHDFWSNRLLEIDPVQGEVTRELLAVDQPSLLRLTDDATRLYVVVKNGAEVWRLQQPEGVVDQRIVIRATGLSPIEGSNIVALTTIPSRPNQVAIVSQFAGQRTLSFFENGFQAATDLLLIDENNPADPGELIGIGPGALLRRGSGAITRWDLQGTTWVASRKTEDSLTAGTRMKVSGDRIVLSNGATFEANGLSLAGYLASQGQRVALDINFGRSIYAGLNPSQSDLVLEMATWAQGSLPLASQQYPTGPLDLRDLLHWGLDGVALWTPSELLLLRTDLLPLRAEQDFDRDGIPDASEQTLGFDPHRPDGLVDADGDGMSLAQELIAGTNPANPNDALRATFSGGTDVSLRLRFGSIPGRRYTLEAAAQAVPPWSVVAGPQAATSVESTFEIRPTPGAVSFFRLRVEP